MIMLDMDGTLLTSSNVILESSKMILKKMKENGKKIIIVTGRNISKALPYISEDFADYLLTNNGCIWYSLRDRKIIRQIGLDLEVILILKKYGTLIERVYVDSKMFTIVSQAIKYIEENRNILQLSIHFYDQEKYAEVLSEIKDGYSKIDAQIMQDSFRSNQWLDILPEGNNKGSNCVLLSKYLNIDSNNMLCFGDGLNDLSMFEVCKVAVAMGNALPELKRLATYITDSNDEDGIYNFLKNYDR